MVVNGQFLYNRPSFPSQLNFAHPLTRGLVSCWVLNENSPNSMRTWDSSPYGNHGTVAGTKGYWHGRTFVAANSEFVTCGTNSVLDLTVALTLLVWARTSSTGNVTLFSSVPNDVGALGYIFGVNETSNYKTEFYTNTAGWKVSNTNVNDGTWHLLGVTANGTTTFYVDGVADGSSAQTMPDAAAGNNKYIGQYGGIRFWDGDIGGLWVYNRLLVASEIKAFYLEPYEMFL